MNVEVGCPYGYPIVIVYWLQLDKRENLKLTFKRSGRYKHVRGGFLDDA